MIGKRQTDAILYSTYRLTSKSELTDNLVANGIEYNRQTRGMKGHKLGSPSWHIWDEIVDHTEKKLATLETSQDVEKRKEQMKIYRETFKTPGDYIDEVRQVKIWESEQSHILMVNATGSSMTLWTEVILPTLKDILVRTESPMAPPSHNERKLKKFIQRRT
eukprot:TRINITY_DN12797_c0_g2_i1.p1 TRINITY_DN12797_c0_g2~~TRINITY_DN12797_c0_g2_i1.p1  ORF type:complete len:162 (-),score=48.57 TRINITY_DN12797_c0_g2_i1:148-633(-)